MWHRTVMPRRTSKTLFCLQYLTCSDYATRELNNAWSLLSESTVYLSVNFNGWKVERWSYEIAKKRMFKSLGSFYLLFGRPIDLVLIWPIVLINESWIWMLAFHDVNYFHVVKDAKWCFCGEVKSRYRQRNHMLLWWGKFETFVHFIPYFLARIRTTKKTTPVGRSRTTSIWIRKRRAWR